ncbi:uncharacterized protein G2W53_024193 [Senna tora]|uniref:Uncharacterized protein n=1 Tax=Senna tora TaxID=362788 RepID=A0A834TAU8_9FABA|nr:uncharacterized protein G2W53_024193 [Senna tora]
MSDRFAVFSSPFRLVTSSFPLLFIIRLAFDFAPRELIFERDLLGSTCVSSTTTPLPRCMVSFSLGFSSLGCSPVSKFKDLLHDLLVDSSIVGSVDSPVTSFGGFGVAGFLVLFGLPSVMTLETAASDDSMTASESSRLSGVLLSCLVLGTFFSSSTLISIPATCLLSPLIALFGDVDEPGEKKKGGGVVLEEHLKQKFSLTLMLLWTAIDANDGGLFQRNIVLVSFPTRTDRHWSWKNWLHRSGGDPRNLLSTGFSDLHSSVLESTLCS